MIDLIAPPGSALDWHRRRELHNAFECSPWLPVLEVTVAGHCDTDLLDLATLADNTQYSVIRLKEVASRATTTPTIVQRPYL